MLKNKLLVYCLVLFMGFCLVLSPHFVFNVAASSDYFVLLDTDDQGYAYRAVCKNDTYIYAITYDEDHIYAYTFDGTTLNYVATGHINGYDMNFDVDCDGTYIYVTTYWGLAVLSFNGTDFTYIKRYNTDPSSFVFCENGYIFFTRGVTNKGIYALTFNGIDFTLIDSYSDGAEVFEGVYINNSIVYSASHNYLYALSFNGTDFTYKDKISVSDSILGISSDDTYIYCASNSLGIFAYTYNEFGDEKLLLKGSKDDGNNYQDVTVVNGIIFATVLGDGIRAYTFDGSTFTLVDTKDDGGTYYRLCSNSTYIYVATSTDGLKTYDVYYIPILSNENPSNNSLFVSLSPVVNVTVTEPGGNTMNITFASNYTGSWVNYQTNSSVGNGSYSWNYIGASSGYTKYFWRVYVNNSNVNVSETYCFTTNVSEGCDGALTINAFDENTSLNVSNFYVMIVDSSGDTFYDSGLSNPWVYNSSYLPQNDNIIIIVGASGYHPRSYTLDIHNGYFYIDGVYYINVTINAYLPPIDISHLYYAQVIDEYLYAVSDARVVIQGLVGGSYVNVSDTLTDGMGYTSVYLEYDKPYQVIISKTGYTTKSAIWIPDPSYYGIFYPKVFKINHSFSGNVSYNFWDVISFTGTMYTNGSIKVTYVDSLTDTINATFKTYELYNGTSTLKSTNVTTNDTFIFWVYNINASRTHQVTLFLNHTILGYKVASITLLPVNITKLNTTYIEDKIKDVFGDFDLGYVKFLFIYLPCIVIIVLGGTINTGLGVIGAGLWVGISSQFLSVPSGVVVLVPFIIVLGILLMIAKGGRIHL